MINEFVDRLTADSGVGFVRDAWIKAPSGDYGVVDIVSASSLWADNMLIEQAPLLNVWLYTHSADNAIPDAVEAVMQSFDGSMGWHVVGREYLDDVNLIRWQWQIRLEEM